MSYRNMFESRMVNFAHDLGHGLISLTHKDASNLAAAARKVSQESNVDVTHEQLVIVDRSREPYRTYINPSSMASSIVNELNR